MMELAYTTSPHIPGDSHKIGKGIYAVADGVTGIGKKDAVYFNLHDEFVKIPAKIFCEETISFLEKTKKIGKDNLFLAFETANKKIFLANKKRISSSPINYLDIDYLSTTAALGIISLNKIYGMRICDCDITILRDHKINFQTPYYWSTVDNFSFCKFNEEIPQDSVLERGWKNKHLRNNSKIGGGYGVLTGEKEALRFVDFYEKEIKTGDIIIFSTDGFRPYFELNEFLNIFSNWKNNKETLHELDKLSTLKQKQDPKFASERTLIAVKV